MRSTSVMLQEPPPQTDAEGHVSADADRETQRRRHRRLLPLRSAGAALACALTLAACAYDQSYPSSWSRRSEGCTDVSGFYADAGERQAPQVPFPLHGTVVTTRSLSGLLRGMGEHGKPFRVELTQRERTLDFRVWIDGTVGSRYSVQYHCTPEGVEVTLPPRWVFEGLGAVRAWGLLHLTKDIEGNLISGMAYHAYGVVLIVPIASGGEVWYRFEAAAAPS